MHIPNDYVNSVPERLALYTSLNALNDNKGLQAFLEDVQDRFGKVPEEVKELCNAIRLKWVGKTLALERIIARRVSSPATLPLIRRPCFVNKMPLVKSWPM